MEPNPPTVSRQRESSSDASVAIPPQSRADRIAVLSDALVAVDRPRALARMDFLGNPPREGIAGCNLEMDRLPGGWIRVAVRPRLLALKAPSRGVPSPADRCRGDAMRAAGWEGTRVWELDPADVAAVGQVVDAIQVVLDVSLVPPGVEWAVSPPEAPDPVPSEPPPDEPWVEEATEQDLRERLIRLAGLRGGRILVRFPGPSATIAIDARLRRGTIIAGASSLSVAGASDQRWKANWTLPPGGSSAARIFEELRGALRHLSPPESGDRLAVRLEQHDVAQAFAESYAFFLGWLLSLPVALILGIVATNLDRRASLISVLGELKWGKYAPIGDQVGGFALLIAVIFATVVAAAFAAWAVDQASQRFGWRYTTGEALQTVAGLAGSVAYFGLVFAAGEAWRLVLAAPWVLLIGTAVLRRFGRNR
jgi:hypothetical protein